MMKSGRRAYTPPFLKQHWSQQELSSIHPALFWKIFIIYKSQIFWSEMFTSCKPCHQVYQGNVQCFSALQKDSNERKFYSFQSRPWRCWCILRSINVFVIPNLIRSIHVKLCVWLPTSAFSVLFHFFEGSPSPTQTFPATSTLRATAAILKEFLLQKYKKTEIKIFSHFPLTCLQQPLQQRLSPRLWFKHFLSWETF